MTKINLLPKDIVIKEDRPEIALLSMSGLVAVVVVLGYIYFSKTVERKELKTQISTVVKELQQLQAVVDKIAQIKKEREVLTARKNAIEGLVKMRLVYPILMENILKSLPPGMWLSNLNTSSGAEGMTAIKFNAFAFNNYIVSDLLKTLEQSKIFQNPQMSGINSVSGEKGKILKQFSITVEYKNQGWQ